MALGVPSDFIRMAKVGMAFRDYEVIGLQYGICIGATVGIFTAWLRSTGIRRRLVSTTLALILVALSVIEVAAMNAEFRKLSAGYVDYIPKRWNSIQERHGSVNSSPPMTDTKYE